MNKKETFILEYASLATDEEYTNIMLTIDRRISEARILVRVKSLYASLVKEYGYLYRFGSTGHLITKYIRSTYCLSDEDAGMIFLSFFGVIYKLHGIKRHLDFVDAIEFLITSLASLDFDYTDRDSVDEYFSITLEGFFDGHKSPTLSDYEKVFGVF